MGTGGKIPSARTGSFAFMNTSGIIDKEHNIYFCPDFSNESGTFIVRVKYLLLLNSLCPSPSEYSAISCNSGWSPEDKQLVIKGNIDDFRTKLSSPNSYGLNYMVYYRTVTINGSTTEYYYGFFIDKAEQAGGGSVRLTLSPDYFTNVFFLSNETVLTTESEKKNFDPFNSVMKNCYVERQHYDRVRKGICLKLGVENSVRFTSKTGNGIMRIDDGGETRQYELTASVPQATGCDYYLSQITGSEHTYVTGSTVRIYGDGNPNGYPATVLGSRDVYLPLMSYKDIFLNQQLKFPYKYQYRDLKFPILTNIGVDSGPYSLHESRPSNFSEAEIQKIRTSTNLREFTDNQIVKILKSCIAWLVAETKSLELLANYYYSNTLTHNKLIGKLGTGNGEYGGVNRPNVKIAFPMFIPPKELERLNLSRQEVRFKKEYLTGDCWLQDGREVLKFLQDNALSEYIYSAYIVRDINLLSEVEIAYSVSSSYPYKTIATYYFTVSNNLYSSPLSDSEFEVFPSGTFLGALLTNPDYISHKSDWENCIGFYKETEDTYYVFQNNYPRLLYGLIYDDSQPNKIILDLFREIPNVKTTRYDPVLEAEPYSFFSISTLSSMELPLEKNRYYTDYESFVYLNRYISINGSIKIGVIPSYTVETKTSDYFNTALVYTLNASLPLASDSYSSYYYRNKAQMKNQYAVNNYNSGVDLLQHFFVGGPNAVGNRASKAGGWGALAETGVQVMDMVNEAIDWSQQNHNIDLNQKSKLADVSRAPDTLSQAGSDVYYDIKTGEFDLFLNHYRIDDLSYRLNARLYERFGYEANKFDNINFNNRVGWNYVKLFSFDFISNYVNIEQEREIRNIFSNGVTLLHDKDYILYANNLCNYERRIES